MSRPAITVIQHLQTINRNVLVTRYSPDGSEGSSTRPLLPGQRLEVEVQQDGTLTARIIEENYVEKFYP